MIIKEAVYEKKTVVQNVVVSDTVYGCDECLDVIKLDEEDNLLTINVFYEEDENKQLHFCSWDCVFKHLPKNNFISLSL